jgi:hypothetical protein
MSPFSSDAKVAIIRMLFFQYDARVKQRNVDSGLNRHSFIPVISSNYNCPLGLAMQHVPPLESMEVVLDLYALIHAALLANVLHPGTYLPANTGSSMGYAPAQDSSNHSNHDLNAICHDDRVLFAVGRGVALNLVQWINAHYHIRPKQVGSVANSTVQEADRADLSNAYFVWLSWLSTLLNAIHRYKEAAERDGHRGVLGCTGAALRRQIIDLLAVEPAAQSIFLNSEQNPFPAFDFDNPSATVVDTFESTFLPSEDYEVYLRDHPLVWEGELFLCLLHPLLIFRMLQRTLISFEAVQQLLTCATSATWVYYLRKACKPDSR